MTASQKDGVVRVWSWNIDPSVNEPSLATPPSRIICHIIIKLTNPQSRGSPSARNSSRRRTSRSPVTDISCDVARWLCDDLRIVTSQCEYARQNSSTIVPGSQFIFVWDSIKGHCLMCIDNAHRMHCPLVLPHPQLSSIICSAGADGWLRIWDLERSECVYSFENIAEYGPFDPDDRGQSVGFLDGDMSPDGVDLVLTDDRGRVIVFSSNGVASSTNFPGWAREQYFSNDYYDLIYDDTGYCVR
jgi:WD40 repeat protein